MCRGVQYALGLLCDRVVIESCPEHPPMTKTGKYLELFYHDRYRDIKWAHISGDIGRYWAILNDIGPGSNQGEPGQLIKSLI